MEKCDGDIKQAKFFENVIGPALFDIPLDKVKGNALLKHRSYRPSNCSSGMPTRSPHIAGNLR